MQLNEIFKEDKYTEAYNYAIENGYTIREVDRDIDGSRNFQIVEIPPLSEEELKQIKIYEIQTKLNELNYDIIQDIAGEIVPNIEERKAEFITLHNELRILLGKECRQQSLK